jgi:signal transduction histidine kinase
MNVENVDISSVLYRAVDIVRSRYNLDDNILRITDPPDDLLVLGDEADLITVFVNLLDNAVKYSNHDRKISVRVKQRGLNNKVDIFIRDNGLGIPQDELKRIFKRFYRVPTSSSKETKGTGLGLAIVQTIIKKHGGKISVDSKGEGRGTTFVVQLPLV